MNKKYTIKKSKVILLMINTIILAICCLFSRFPFFDLVAFAVWIAYMGYLVLRHSKEVVRYLYFIFITNAVILSVFICDFFQGYYLNELDTYTGYVGALPILIIGEMLFSFILINDNEVYNNNLISNKSEGKGIKILRVFNFFVLVLCLYLFLNIITKPAFLLGIDRTTYAALITPKNALYSAISGQINVLISIPILLLLYDKKYKIYPLISIFLYGLYYIWNGNKFGPFLSLACLFFMLYTSDYSNINKRKIKKFLKYGLGFIIIAIVSAVFIQSYLSGLKSDDYFIRRLAQQGQLWWKTYDISLNAHPEEFLNEINSIFSDKKAISDYVGSNTGIYKIMYLCGPKSLVDHRLTTGSRYTEGGFACAYYYFGIVGVVLFAFFNGIVVKKIVKSIFSSAGNQDYIKFILLIRLYLRYNAFISMFTLAELFDAGCIITYVYLILMYNKQFVIEKGKLMISKC